MNWLLLIRLAVSTFHLGAICTEKYALTESFNKVEPSVSLDYRRLKQLRGFFKALVEVELHTPFISALIYFVHKPGVETYQINKAVWKMYVFQVSLLYRVDHQMMFPWSCCKPGKVMERGYRNQKKTLLSFVHFITVWIYGIQSHTNRNKKQVSWQNLQNICTGCQRFRTERNNVAHKQSKVLWRRTCTFRYSAM